MDECVTKIIALLLLAVSAVALSWVGRGNREDEDE